jgi:hypothetical protein
MPGANISAALGRDDGLGAALAQSAGKKEKGLEARRNPPLPAGREALRILGGPSAGSES